MVDIPPVPPSAPAPPPAPASLTNVGVEQAPPSLTTPPAPVQLTGTVVASNPQAQQLTLQTPQGRIVVQSAVQLPPQTPVAVQLYTDKAKTLATVTVMKQSLAQQAALEEALPPQAPAPLPPLKEGAAVTALKLQNAALPPAVAMTPPAADAMPDETAPSLIRRLLDSSLPGQAAPPLPGEAPLADVIDNNLAHIIRAQFAAKAAQSTLQPQPGALKPASFLPLAPIAESWIRAFDASVPQTTESGLTALLKQLMPQTFGADAGASMLKNMYRLDIVKILPPGTPDADVTALLQKTPDAAAARVDAATTHGLPILTAGEDHFVVRTPASVPAGSTIVFRAAPATPEDIAAGPLLPAAPDFDPLQSARWPALEEALNDLKNARHPAAPAALQALSNTVPAPTAQMAPATLFFLAALRSGALENWLGANTLQTLKQAGRKGLLERLTGDFDRMSAQAKETPAGEWRAVTVPLRHDEHLSQMQFYVRRQRDENEKDRDGGKPATRFILNLSLSRMGALQLDGFIQKKSFDMILRTEDRLPFDMRQEIMKRFAAGLEQVHMQGGISFQTRQEGWMVPEVRKTIREA